MRRFIEQRNVTVRNGQRLATVVGGRRHVRIATIVASLVVVTYALVQKPFVLNLSPSVPLGIYAKDHGEPRAGALVEFRCPLSLPGQNHLFGKSILKPILAGPGDHVDTTADCLLINGFCIAPIYTQDRHGNPLPVWRANRILKQDEFFVFSDRVFNSFDSRYFGPIKTGDIVAVRMPLWTWGKVAERFATEPCESASTTDEWSFLGGEGKTRRSGMQDKTAGLSEAISACGSALYEESPLPGRLSVFVYQIWPGDSEGRMPRERTNDADPDQIARPGLGGGQRSQALRIPGARHRIQARGSTTFERNPLRQRVTVKTGYSRHHSPQHGRASLSRRVDYLTREAVQLGGESGRFYDATRTDVDVEKEIHGWAGDRHHFHTILSPENAQSLGDLTSYTREVMTRVERDLGVLQWFAVNHTNTDNPHIHVLIRGKNQDGSDLVISRKYISRGIRDRASDVATEWLGERTREQAQTTLAKEARAERWTALDGALGRLARSTPEGLKIDFKDLRLSRHGLITHEFLANRLGFLKDAGLAHQVKNKNRTFLGRAPAWLVASDFQQRLNALEERQYIIKGLYASLGAGAAAIAPKIQSLHATHNLADNGRRMGRGVVIAKGRMNEFTDERFVVVEDRAGKLHFFRVWAGKEFSAVRVGAVVEIGRAALRQWRMAQEIRRVAEYAKDMLYSAARHREWIQAQSPRPASGEMEKRLGRFARWITKLAGRPNSGIARSGRGPFSLDYAKLNQFLAKHTRWPDVRVIAAHPLTDQVQAQAYTWLDRQLIRTQRGKKTGRYDLLHNPRVQAALSQRSNWLIENGYARMDPKEGSKRIEFVTGAIRRLVSHEHQQFVRRCHQKYRKCFIDLSPGQSARGIFRGVANEHRGAFALIETERAIFAAPISRAPSTERGQRVIAKGVAPGFARIEIDRPAGKVRHLGLER